MGAILANWPLAALIAVFCGLGYGAFHAPLRARFACRFIAAILVSALCVLSLYFFVFVDPGTGYARRTVSGVLFALAWWLFERAKKTLRDIAERGGGVDRPDLIQRKETGPLGLFKSAWKAGIGAIGGLRLLVGARRREIVLYQSKRSIGVIAVACLLTFTPALAGERTIQEVIALVHAGKGTEARAAFAELADAGSAEALYHLGALHHSGIGGDQDLARAAYWYDKASEAGVVEAKLALGSLFYKGKGVTKDLARALTLFTQAAEAGLLAAQYNLGMMHAAGLAHTKEYNADEDKPRAYKWLTIVLARLDDEQARANIEEGLKLLVDDMLPWEIEKGENMAKQWLAEHGGTESAQ